MGSFSRIADKKGTMDLFGPVNKLYCTSYDRAMVSFLACLKVRSQLLTRSHCSSKHPGNRNVLLNHPSTLHMPAESLMLRM